MRNNRSVSRSVGKSEEYQQGTVQTHKVSIGEVPEMIAQVRSRHCTGRPVDVNAHPLIPATFGPSKNQGPPDQRSLLGAASGVNVPAAHRHSWASPAEAPADPHRDQLHET